MDTNNLLDKLKKDPNNIHDVMREINNNMREGNFLDQINILKSVLNNNFLDIIKRYTGNLEDIYLYQTQTNVLEEENFLTLLEMLFDNEENHEKKYKYALIRPDHEKFKKYIDEYEKNKSVKISHSLSDIAFISETNYTKRTEDFTIGLFKSKQEKIFYSAARNVFPNCFVCPNVAISCIIDIKKIKEIAKLSKKEEGFFYKGIVDCVIYEIAYDENDNYVNFKPRYFIELDSELHEDPERKANDKLKDSIFGKAGLSIMRIRPTNSKKNPSLAEFEKMLIEQQQRTNKIFPDTTSITAE